MQFQLVSIEELTDSLRQTWLEWVRSDLQYMSPYFHPDFAFNMAQVRDDVRLILFCEEDEVVGILPIHLKEGNSAAPIGDTMSDYHGVISGKPLKFDLRQLLRETSINSFYFDHLLAAQTSFEPYSWEQSTSPYMDLSNGFEAYEKQCKQGGTSFYKNLLRNERKMLREVGEPRIVEFSDDETVMDRLLELKSQQYERTRQLDLTQIKWMTDSIRQIWKFRSDDFSGILSVLYVDDKLLAMHFGIKTRDALHWWFPTYEPEYRRYSPGLLLLLHLARSQDLGLKYIDLGKGPEEYKTKMNTGETKLFEGGIDQRTIRRWLYQNIHHTRKWVHNTPAAQSPLKVYKEVRSAFRKIKTC
ncbi:hypothetical protein Pla110_30520 [Polystyrenella longa]|uniref:BioF2-like acetyltransferase domain-containing protein n=1 Tax=Polystyrenella longa TaxID=2528007 RepID=A0A518CQ02_9PLAN|nr:GNAT family N-acetyltransferase [Polystyrenella longa]QDU81311.1 hypothetical protein Pla110_30520 [Polystyrenella longa]